MNERASQIIDVAIQMIREGGYHSFSFRQIGNELDIKSASIHYHFPSKEDLGGAVVKRYSEAFLGSLKKPSDHKKPADFYINAFQTSLEQHESGCMCGILAAESGRLPQSIIEALSEFTTLNIEWMEAALRLQCADWSEAKIKESALAIFSALEGAMIFASLTKQPAHLKKVGDWLKKLCV